MNQDRFKFSGTETPLVSVAIELTDPQACSFHTGILYRDEDSRLFKLHLGWHCEFYHHPYLDDDSCCAIPELDIADAEYLAGFCQRIGNASSNQSIPYSLKYDPDVQFNEKTGEVVIGDGSTGLGCSTFVLAAFRSSGNPLVDLTDWPANRPGDREVQQLYVDLLLASNRAERREQGLRIRNEVGGVRVRPEETAGACLETPIPARFLECEQNGKFIIDEIVKRRLQQS